MAGSTSDGSAARVMLLQRASLPTPVLRRDRVVQPWDVTAGLPCRRQGGGTAPRCAPRSCPPARPSPPRALRTSVLVASLLTSELEHFATLRSVRRTGLRRRGAAQYEARSPPPGLLHPFEPAAPAWRCLSCHWFWPSAPFPAGGLSDRACQNHVHTDVASRPTPPTAPAARPSSRPPLALLAPSSRPPPPLGLSSSSYSSIDSLEDGEASGPETEALRAEASRRAALLSKAFSLPPAYVARLLTRQPRLCLVPLTALRDRLVALVEATRLSPQQAFFMVCRRPSVLVASPGDVMQHCRHMAAVTGLPLSAAVSLVGRQPVFLDVPPPAFKKHLSRLAAALRLKEVRRARAMTGQRAALPTWAKQRA